MRTLNLDKCFEYSKLLGISNIATQENKPKNFIDTHNGLYILPEALSLGLN